ncbi:DUF6538 domain-containing protein [Bradyrhizobium sp. BWC-3-1]|uniref:DUF6538 domain-containing protein n=1 Tax=Bradyrhizobium sp. BWC-3-1 TaxID=3080012 RepID=UPI00293E8B9F|nr:DUF6538 domain-containing protein [Bradyrhizobium sp. BWC-3-1]WOH55857.1 DUF6538 domain-containing protein [Bradyrhizobium sp. BWC-3-1]
MNVILRAEKGGGDRRYLTQPRGEGTTWYAVAEVPRTLRQAIGKKRLLKSLETTDLRVARIARWNAVADLKSEIAKHRMPGSEDQDPLLLEAMALREEFVRADAARRNDLMYQITDRAEEIDLAAGGIREDYAPFGEPRAATKQATEFIQLASAKAKLRNASANPI